MCVFFLFQNAPIMTAQDVIELINNGSPMDDIRSLIESSNGDIDLDTSVGNIGLCALHHAVYKNRSDCVQYFVEHGCNINVQDECGFTALHLATKYCRADIMKQLLQLEANIDVEDAVGCPALNLALQNGYEDCAEILLEAGANPNKHYKYVGYEIHQLQDDTPKCLEMLLKHGADPELRNTRGLTSLHLAIKNANILYVYTLLQHGADSNAVCYTMTQAHNKRSALHLAVIGAEKGIAELLLVHGADVNIRDGLDNTPLHHVAAHGLVDIAQLLINNGALISAENDRNYQPLHRACAASSNTSMIALLLDNGADTNAMTAMLESPMKLLLRHVAKVSNSSDSSSTFDCREGVLLLVNHGANVTLTTDLNDHTNILPYLQALSENHLLLIYLLLEVVDVMRISPDAEQDLLSGLDDHLQEHILMVSGTPRTLYHLARRTIRRMIGVPCSKHSIDLLEIPSTLKKYLRFEQ